MSVTANPACPDLATAERAVNEVWDSCFSDTRPFDEVRVLFSYHLLPIGLNLEFHFPTLDLLNIVVSVRGRPKRPGVQVGVDLDGGLHKLHTLGLYSSLKLNPLLPLTTVITVPQGLANVVVKVEAGNRIEFRAIYESSGTLVARGLCCALFVFGPINLGSI